MKNVLSTSILVLMLGIVSCKKAGTNSLDTATVGVTNDTDNLNIGFARMDNVDDSRTYTYTTTGPNATLSIGATLTRGSIEVKIKDSAGSVIYDNSFSAISADNSTLSSSSSTWTVEVELLNSTGEFGLALTTED